MLWRRSDGTPVPVSVRSSPVLDAEGRVIGGSAIVRDIAERQRAARRLAESERRLAAIVTQATVGVAQTDLAGRCQLVNPRFCELMGRSAAQLEGMRIQQLVHPDDVAAREAAFASLVAGGPPIQSEERYVRPDGTVIRTSNHISLIQDDDGRPAGVVAVVLDVTAR